MLLGFCRIRWPFQIDDRCLGGRDAQGTQQVLGLGILLQVDPLVGDPVAAREVPEPPGVRVVASTR